MVACCDRAQRMGVVAGMPLAEATALAKRNRDVETNFIEQELEEDRAALSELAVWCEQFSPIVGLEQDERASSLLLDITGLEPIFGGEPRLLDLVSKAFAQRQYQVRLGVGTTVGAAWAMAHYHTDQDLLELPVEALRIDEVTLDILQQLGVETIAQLLQLPRTALASRLGEGLIQRIDQLTGKQPEVIVAHHAPPQFEVEWSLEHPTHRRDAIEKVLERLSERLAKSLQKQDHAVVQAEATLCGKRTTRLLTISLFQPSNLALHLYDLLKLQCETAQFREPIHRVTLSATATVRLHVGQQMLWDDLDAFAGQGGQREIASLVDRLSSRLGKERVYGVCAQAGALPEKAYRRKSLSTTMRQRKAKTAETLKAPHRPLWLQEPPQPLRFSPSSSLPPRAARAQPPASFQFHNQHHNVRQHWGPERIETGWWRGRTVRRDYYRVETTEGCRFWLFRRVNDGAWFVHGCFE